MNKSILLAALSALAIGSGLSVTEAEAQVNQNCDNLRRSRDVAELQRIAFNPRTPIEAACSDIALNRLVALNTPAAGPQNRPNRPY